MLTLEAIKTDTLEIAPHVARLIQLAKEAYELCGRLSDAQDEAANEFDDSREAHCLLAWFRANRRMWRRLYALKRAGYNGAAW